MCYVYNMNNGRSIFQVVGRPKTSPSPPRKKKKKLCVILYLFPFCVCYDELSLINQLLAVSKIRCVKWKKKRRERDTSKLFIAICLFVYFE